MKHMKKLAVALIAVVAAFALCVPALAFAQQEPADATVDATKATITIENPSKGETYTLYKIFDATVTGDEGGSIAYRGTVPSFLEEWFEKIDGTDYVQLKDGVTEEDYADIIAAIQENFSSFEKVTETVSDGTAPLKFVNLDFGYYVIATTHKDSQQGKALVTVNSTNPNMSVIDKNSSIPVNDLSKTVDKEEVNIGEVVTYTISFETANYAGDDLIDKYVIEDTLPSYLTLAADAVQSIIVDDGTQHDVTAQFNEKKIEITWAENNASKYANGAKITITYKATVNKNIEAGDVDNNKNTVTVTPYHGSSALVNYGDDDSAIIKTYAAALKKVDENNNALAGASFQVNGLIVEGEPGNYDVVSFDPESTSAGSTMLCDADGKLVISGLSGEDDVNAVEVAAPNGYNKLVGSTAMTIVKIQEVITTESSTGSTTTYYDSDGNVVQQFDENGYYVTTTTNKSNVVFTDVTAVVNKTGTVLPSTGGMGTTILYIVGGIMIVVAAVFLVGRRRASKDKDSDDQM